MTPDILRHALEYSETLERGSRILNVRIDLPINPASPGFSAERLHDLNVELAKRLDDGRYDRIDLRSNN